MRNAVSFYKHYRPYPAVSSRLRTAALMLAAACWATVVVAAAGGVPLQVPGTPSPALAAWFTPGLDSDRYEVRVLGAGIERARQLVVEAVSGGAATASPVRQLDPLEAFGAAGSYPRTTVARLYTARRCEVVRIPVTREGRTVAALTLVSPYPDATLTRLVEGTMVIVMKTSN
jgi:hypothetical protein